jgi:hypothetical protein
MNGRALVALRGSIARASWTSRPIFSVLAAFSAVLLTTLVLLLIDSFISADDMPGDKFLLLSRKGKRLGVAYASTPRGEGGAGSLKFKTK